MHQNDASREKSLKHTLSPLTLTSREGLEEEGTKFQTRSVGLLKAGFFQAGFKGSPLLQTSMRLKTE